jgi:hypothetical protein
MKNSKVVKNLGKMAMAGLASVLTGCGTIYTGPYTSSPAYLQAQEQRAQQGNQNSQNVDEMQEFFWGVVKVAAGPLLRAAGANAAQNGNYKSAIELQAAGEIADLSYNRETQAIAAEKSRPNVTVNNNYNTQQSSSNDSINNTRPYLLPDGSRLTVVLGKPLLWKDNGDKIINGLEELIDTNGLFSTKDKIAFPIMGGLSQNFIVEYKIIDKEKKSALDTRGVVQETADSRISKQLVVENLKEGNFQIWFYHDGLFIGESDFKVTKE